MIKHFGFAALLLATTACTQPAAQVELKGQQSFTRSGSAAPAVNLNRGNNSGYVPYTPPPVYTNTMPVDNTTQTTAHVDSIGVSDLSAPPKAAKTVTPPAAPAQKADTPVNGWTKRPHGSSDDQSLNVAPAAKPVAKAEPAAEPKKLAAAETKPIKGLMWPVNGKKIISNFGPKGGGKANDGINIASAEGEPVWAAADGQVVYVGNELTGYGNMILIKHPGDKATSYAHLSRATVDKYERVKQGDIIGYVGSTGNVKTPQLFFAVRDGNTAVDPRKYLTSEVAGL